MQPAPRYVPSPLPGLPNDSRYVSGARLASAVVSALHVFPSVETCGDGYLLQQRRVRQLCLPGLFHSDLLFLSSPLCVVPAGPRHFLPFLQQRGECSAYGPSLPSPRFLRDSNALRGVVRIFWVIWFVGAVAIRAEGVGTSFAGVSTGLFASAWAIQAVGVVVEGNSVAVAISGVGDFCWWPSCRGSLWGFEGVQSAPRVQFPPVLASRSHFPQRWRPHWTFRSVESSCLAC